MRKDHLNLTLEICSLCFFLVSLVFVTVLVVLVFTIVGIEFTDDLPEPSKLEVIAQSPAGYLISILVFVLLASFPLFTATMIRSFLVRPESFPWLDPEEPST